MVNNRIEEVKKILEGYFSEELGEGASQDIAEEISQIFTQPLDELKVLVDGEWVEASKELKDTVRSIEQAFPDKIEEARKQERRKAVDECFDYFCALIMSDRVITNILDQLQMRRQALKGGE